MNMQPQRQRSIYLTPENIMRYLLGNDDGIDTIINCRGSEVSITTYDSDLYSAVGSLKPYDEIQMHRLAKFLEVVDILPYRQAAGAGKRVLTNERVDELRTRALAKKTR